MRRTRSHLLHSFEPASAGNHGLNSEDIDQITDFGGPLNGQNSSGQFTFES
jgi:hypothetical protein